MRKKKSFNFFKKTFFKKAKFLSAPPHPPPHFIQYCSSKEVHLMEEGIASAKVIPLQNLGFTPYMLLWTEASVTAPLPYHLAFPNYSWRGMVFIPTPNSPSSNSSINLATYGFSSSSPSTNTNCPTWMRISVEQPFDVTLISLGSNRETC